MKEHLFKELLRAERDRVLPTCPTNLEANVLRRVRLASSDAEAMSGFDWLFGLLPQKGVAFGVLAITLFLSVTSTMVVTSGSLRAAETQSRAVTALDFEVFKETQFLNLGD
jgi:hypothetical protein